MNKEEIVIEEVKSRLFMYGYMKLAAKPKRRPSLRRVESCPLVTERLDGCPLVTVSPFLPLEIGNVGNDPICIICIMAAFSRS